MAVASELEVVAARLEEYQRHLASINSALEALRHLGEVLGASIAQDSRTILALALEQSGQPAAEAASHDPVLADEEPAIAPVEPTAAVTETPPADEVASLEPPPLPLDTSVVTALHAVAVARASEDGGAPASASVSDTQPAPAVTVQSSGRATKIIDLASWRPKLRLPRPSRRRGIGMAASLLVTAMVTTYAVQGLAQTDILQRVMELTTCDGEAVAAHRDCALLAWMLL